MTLDNKKWLGLIALAWGMGWSTSVFAQLQWQQQELELRPALSDTQAVAKFSFENKGHKAVTITSVKSSCGCCTAVQFDKTVYQPGETGVITTSFIFGDRRGLQEKVVTVLTDDSVQSETKLYLKVWIPEIIKMSPTFVSWKPEEEKQSQEVLIGALEKESVLIKNLHSSNPQMKVELKTLEEGRKYQVVITPPKTQLAVSSTVRFETVLASQTQTNLIKPRQYYFHAFIKPTVHTVTPKL